MPLSRKKALQRLYRLVSFIHEHDGILEFHLGGERGRIILEEIHVFGSILYGYRSVGDIDVLVKYGVEPTSAAVNLFIQGRGILPFIRRMLKRSNAERIDIHSAIDPSIPTYLVWIRGDTREQWSARLKRLAELPLGERHRYLKTSYRKIREELERARRLALVVSELTRIEQSTLYELLGLDKPMSRRKLEQAKRQAAEKLYEYIVESRGCMLKSD